MLVLKVLMDHKFDVGKEVVASFTFQMCLKCVVRLCEVTPEGADRFVDVIHSSFGFVPGQMTFPYNT